MILPSKKPAAGVPPQTVAPSPVPQKAPPVAQPPAPRPTVQAPPPPVPAPPPVVQQTPTPVTHAAVPPVAHLPAQAPPVAPRAMTVSRPAPAVLPAFVESAGEGELPVGFENMGNEGYSMPMLSIAQAQSPQVQETRTLNVGDTYLTTDRDKQFFPPGVPVTCLPFFYYKSYDLWNHRDLGGGIIEASVDPNGAIAKLAARQMMEKRKNPQPTADQQPEQAVESLVFLVLFKDCDADGNVIGYMPVAIPFTKGKYKKAKLWLQLAQKVSQGKYPLYSQQYTITSVLEKGKRGSFYTFDVDFAEDPITEQDYAKAKEAYTEFKAMYDQRALKTVTDATDATPEAEIVGPAGGPVPGAEPSKAY